MNVDLLIKLKKNEVSKRCMRKLRGYIEKEPIDRNEYMRAYMRNYRANKKKQL